MPVDPRLVNELRSAFKVGATPSALVRRVALRHPNNPRPDVLVRDYFREAFHVPMVRIGPEQVAAVAAGASLPALNLTVLPRMVETRPLWDSPGESWLDGLPDKDGIHPAPETLPELAASWDRMDDAAREFVRRLLDTARAAHDRAAALAALAERLQEQAAPAAGRPTRQAS